MFTDVRTADVVEIAGCDPACGMSVGLFVFFIILVCLVMVELLQLHSEAWNNNNKML
jgi:hypothetical protein